MASESQVNVSEETKVLVAQFTGDAQALGLTDDEATQYVASAMREWRIKNRELEKTCSLELKKKQLELDRMVQIEAEKLALDRERFNLEKRKVDNAEVAQKAQEKAQVKSDDNRKIKNYPKLPYFDEKTDNIESYLYRFEMHAKVMGWDKSQWASILPSLLKGRALVYYHEIAVAETPKYDDLRTHLLKRFRCTEEGFRSQFRTCKPEAGETMHTYFARVKHLFQRWLELASVGADFGRLSDLMLQEQVLASCSTPLAVFLKEGKFASTAEMIEAAERYREAHPGQSMAATGSSSPLIASVGISTPEGKQAKHGQGGRGQGFRRGQFKGQGSGRGHFNQGQTTQESAEANKAQSQGCFNCGDASHWRAQCPRGKGGRGSQGSRTFRRGGFVANVGVQEVVTNEAFEDGSDHIAMVGLKASDDLPSCIQTCDGSLNGQAVSVMLDSGCSTVGVRRSLVHEDQLTGENCVCRQFNGDVVSLPLAIVNLDCPYFSGMVTACVIDNPVCEVILGRIPGVSFACTEVANVVTRAQAKREQRPFRPLLTAKVPQLDISASKLSSLQSEDQSLRPLFGKVGQQGVKGPGGVITSFVLRDGLLYRRLYRPGVESVTWQVAVPTSLRESVCIAAHDGIFGGHMGPTSTFKRLARFFFWPGVRKFVKGYCRSCDICQRTSPKGHTPRAPLQQVPVIDVPFSRLCVDLIGPIAPVSGRGHRYVLTCVDVATRYPEAIPLKVITAESVAEALVEIFSRVGIPDEILSDQGSQFTADIMREVMRLLSVSQLHSTPYHPETNGIVERFNGTLKQMLKKLMADKPSDWDRFLPAALFAYREIPQTSTGFSPFQLLFGRVPKGPTQLLYESWTGSEVPAEQKEVSSYVAELGDSLKDMVHRAQDAVQGQSARSRKYNMRKAHIRNFKAGQKVLVLLPTDHNKMLLRWKGPFPIVKKVKTCDYLVETNPGVHKLFHINLLREYVQRQAVMPVGQVGVAIQSACLGVISGSSCEEDADVQKVCLQTVPTVQSESIKDVVVSPDLDFDQRAQVSDLLHKHAQVLTDLPGSVTIQEHSIPLTEDRVINVKQYPLPFQSEQIVAEEVRKMLSLGVIDPSSSPYSSPAVLVKKKDQSTRFCIDFRHLNKITRFDSETIPDTEASFVFLRGKKYFSKIDLTKGYWQIPLAEEDRPKTAFRTSQGLFQFVRMPFGLSTAPSTFARLMRKLHLDRFQAVHFFDDILVGSETWKEHLKSLDGVFSELHEKSVTARPSKVEIGFSKLEFLGHEVGDNCMRPVESKVSKILNVAVPTTKKQVRSFLGLVGFYRRYLPAYADLVDPLVQLTKKGEPNKVRWTERCDVCYQKLKQLLSEKPVVVLPDFAKQFVIRSDASGAGIGAVLMQEGDDGFLHPVLYASRKLLDREVRYSTIERECLALVWAVDKFHRYIFGREFLVETDHNPLTFLKKSKTTNGRLMRWALSLQDYTFTVIPISGSVNFEADVLSRMGL